MDGRKRKGKQRKFRGNRYTGSLKPSADDVSVAEPTTPVPTPPTRASTSTASSSKLNDSLKKFENISTEEDIEGYRLLDIETLIKFISLSPCAACLSKIKTGRTEAIKPLYKFSETLAGISSVLKITCEYCDDDRIFRVERPGENLNIRFQHAMYSIGIN